MRRELEERTQAPAEPFAEYLRAMQELLQIADPNATNQEQVERVVRQAHPTFLRYMRGRPFGSPSELAQEARRVQADILAERRYHLPPAPTDTLEPRCAWHGPVPRGYRRGEAAIAAARGEPSGNPWELTDDALEPGSRRGGSAARPRRRNSGRPAHHGSPQHRSRLPPTRCHKGARLHKGDFGKRRRPPIKLSAAKQTNKRVPDISSTVCVPTAYRVGTATRTAAPFISLTVAGKEFAALLDSVASASLIGDEVLRHLQQKSVRVRHGETTFQLACGSTTSRGAVRLVDAGVQCSVTLDFQPRIAPGGLSQLGHNRSPSSVHLSGEGGGGAVSWWPGRLFKDPVSPEAAAKPKSTQSTVRGAVAAHPRPRAN
ncbi:hypothetical protein HPB47_014823 [Ixodes persulcatus]|uniref:Uncharacterized protein n=1 Tax=Ixodes persulcatus TaxID=34615 RepID=A0AC60QVY5_IXOPE|nr:hypothetical protein HPB47_014823 [Ixodes persulcatus]